MTASSMPAVAWRTCFFLSLFAFLAWLVLGFTSIDPGVIALYRLTFFVLFLGAMAFGIADYGSRRFFREFGESIAIALAQIRANKLRSALTALGVIIGIVAVTLMGTAILGIDAGVERSLAGFGDDVLYVSKWPWRDVSDWWTYRNRPEIDTGYAQPI